MYLPHILSRMTEIALSRIHQSGWGDIDVIFGGLHIHSVVATRCSLDRLNMDFVLGVRSRCRGSMLLEYENSSSHVIPVGMDEFVPVFYVNMRPTLLPLMFHSLNPSGGFMRLSSSHICFRLYGMNVTNPEFRRCLIHTFTCVPQSLAFNLLPDLSCLMDRWVHEPESRRRSKYRHDLIFEELMRVYWAPSRLCCLCDSLERLDSWQWKVFFYLFFYFFWEHIELGTHFLTGERFVLMSLWSCWNVVQVTGSVWHMSVTDLTHCVYRLHCIMNDVI